MDLRIGLAGLGIHGLRYAKHLLDGDVAGARLVAAHRRNVGELENWCERSGVLACRSLEQLIGSPDVDAIVVVLPPSLHPDAVSRAAAHGKPILVEKPIATNGADAFAAVRAAESAGIPAMVAQTLRFDRVVQTLRREIESIGPIHLIAINQRFEPTSREWIDEPLEGGIVLNTGVHGVDLIRYLSQLEIDSVCGFTRAVATERTADAFVASFGLSDGRTLATLDNSRATGGRSGRIEVVGESGQLAADHVHGWVRRWRGRDAEDIALPAPTFTVREALAGFVDGLRSGTMPIPLVEGAHAVEVIDRLVASAADEESSRVP